jgi:hypothetical protein
MGSKWTPMPVFVREYERVRYGRQEHVCAHWRSLPRQLELPV